MGMWLGHKAASIPEFNPTISHGNDSEFEKFGEILFLRIFQN